MGNAADAQSDRLTRELERYLPGAWVWVGFNGDVHVDMRREELEHALRMLAKYDACIARQVAE